MFPAGNLQFARRSYCPTEEVVSPAHHANASRRSGQGCGLETIGCSFDCCVRAGSSGFCFVTSCRGTGAANVTIPGVDCGNSSWCPVSLLRSSAVFICPRRQRRTSIPVPLKIYDESLGLLRRSLEAARLGHTQKLEGFRRLDRLTRKVEEERQPLSNFDASIRHERTVSASIGGWTVFDDKTPRKPYVPPQLSLF